MQTTVKAHSRARVVLRYAFAAASIIFFSTLHLAYGQSTYGSVVGTVSDYSGAVVANATIKVMQASTGVSRSATSDGRNKEEIDAIILRYTRQFLRAPDLTVAERWYGVYAKHPEKPLVVMQPENGVRIVASPGGSGMTLSFGVAEQSMRDLGFIH